MWTAILEFPLWRAGYGDPAECAYQVFTEPTEDLAREKALAWADRNLDDETARKILGTVPAMPHAVAERTKKNG